MPAPGPVRVLCLVKGLGPGGAERLLVSVAGARDPAAFEMDAAYLLPWKHHLVAELADQGVAVHRLSDHGQRDPRWPAALRSLVVSGRYDVVHSHSPMLAIAARLVVRTMPWSSRPKLVTTEHNSWSSHALVTRFLNAVTWGLDDAHLVVSEDVRHSLWPAWRRARVEVLLHGSDLGPMRAARSDRSAVRRELGVGEEEIVVGTVANFRSQKGYPDLLAAARRVVDSHAGVRFVAVGQGPLENDVRALHDELGLGGRFRLLGYRDDVPRVLAGCDVFVLASRYEGLPVALMEAFAAGLPIVATDVVGIRHMVRNGVDGVLVPLGRPDLLAAALLEVSSDPELRRRLAHAARRRAGDFDIRRTVGRIEELYRHLGSADA